MTSRRTPPPFTPADAGSLVERAVRRGFEDRYAAAEEDVARIIDATYRVMERTGTVDPTVRDILKEAGFSSPVFYRHFASKDELLLVILDDGRRRLVDYLAHRMAKAGGPGDARVRAWIEGVMAQATNPTAAARTRPFVANTARIVDQFPEEHAASIRGPLDLLTAAVTDGTADGSLAPGDLERDAQSVNDLVFAAMERHVLARTRPSPADVRALVVFCDRALGARGQ